MVRYHELVSSPAAVILLSAATFSFMHIIFRNPIAVALTFLGGILFAWRYHHSGSLAASTFEHALYGCLLFSLGLGEYFYHGRISLR
jgi:CAAX protease family protein